MNFRRSRPAVRRPQTRILRTVGTLALTILLFTLQAPAIYAAACPYDAFASIARGYGDVDATIQRLIANLNRSRMPPDELQALFLSRDPNRLAELFTGNQVLIARAIKRLSRETEISPDELDDLWQIGSLHLLQELSNILTEGKVISIANVPRWRSEKSESIFEQMRSYLRRDSTEDLEALATDMRTNLGFETDNAQNLALLDHGLARLTERLTPIEKYILYARLLAQNPVTGLPFDRGQVPSITHIAEKFSIGRERVRSLEMDLDRKLRHFVLSANPDDEASPGVVRVNTSLNADELSDLYKTMEAMPKPPAQSLPPPIDFARATPEERQIELKRQYDWLLASGIDTNPLSLLNLPDEVWQKLALGFHPRLMLQRIDIEFEALAKAQGITPLDYVKLQMGQGQRRQVLRYIPTEKGKAVFGDLTEEQAARLSQLPDGYAHMNKREIERDLLRQLNYMRANGLGVRPSNIQDHSSTLPRTFGSRSTGESRRERFERQHGRAVNIALLIPRIEAFQGCRGDRCVMRFLRAQGFVR